MGKKRGGQIEKEGKEPSRQKHKGFWEKTTGTVKTCPPSWWLTRALRRGTSQLRVGRGSISKPQRWDPVTVCGDNRGELQN